MLLGDKKYAYNNHIIRLKFFKIISPLFSKAYRNRLMKKKIFNNISLHSIHITHKIY